MGGLSLVWVVFPFRTKSRNSWLVLWLFTKEQLFAAYHEPPIAATFDARTSIGSVARYMEAIYDTATPAMAFERASLTYEHSRRKRNEDRGPKWDNFHQYMTHGRNDPFLMAKSVEDLCFDVIDKFHEIAYWTEPEFRGNYDKKGAYSDARRLVRPRRFCKLEMNRIGAIWSTKLRCSGSPIMPAKLPRSEQRR